MTVHYHDYGDVGVGAGGAPINYAEVSRLLRHAPGLAARAHDFHALVAAGDGARLPATPGSGDTVVCTAGPYAHLYHYWREQWGADFRIIRDARTTAWSPYLAQEWLTMPLRRPGDLLIVPSHFAGAFYRQAFPALTATEVCVLYPLAEHLPAAPERPPRRAGGPLRIGCLGRIADDKNTAEAFGLLNLVQRERAAELHLAGAFYPHSPGLRGAGSLAVLAGNYDLAAGSVRYHGDLPYREIWAWLADMDVLYFPAVSSNESFGRVLAEAGRAGVPVIATDHAAAAELLPADALVPVIWHGLQRVRLSQPFSLGRPVVEQAARALLAMPPATDPTTAPRFSGQAFIELVRDHRLPLAETWQPSSGVTAYLQACRLDGLPPLGRAESLALCREQLGFMAALHDRRLRMRLPALARLLPRLPGDPTLRRVVRERLAGRTGIGVLRNAVASGRYLGFDPRLSLVPAAP